jgi:hypothetical protein
VSLSGQNGIFDYTFTDHKDVAYKTGFPRPTLPDNCLGHCVGIFAVDWSLPVKNKMGISTKVKLKAVFGVEKLRIRDLLK